MKNLNVYYFLYYLALSSFSPYMSLFLTEKGISATSSFFSYLIINVFVLITLFFFSKTEASPPKLTLFDQTRQVLWNKPFMIFVGICFFCSLCRRPSILRPCPLYFKESGFEKSWSGIAYSVAAIIEVPMFWIAAKVGDRIGRFYILSVSALFYAIKCLVIY